MVGATDDHMFNHFIRNDIGSRVAGTLLTIWRRDRERVQRVASGGGQGRWIQLNDMSLEYGGEFKIGRSTAATQCNDPANSGSHNSHNLGIDFDLPSCYTRSGGRYISSGDCWDAYQRGGTAEVPLISKALIEEYVIGGGRGVVLVHREGGGDQHHYHIRFNPSRMR